LVNRLHGGGVLVTIRDVAKEAGVSTATVSRVINNKGKITKETQAIVERAIKDLSYTPNVLARSLSNRKSYAVAFIVPTITNPFFPEMARAVEDVARDNGYNILLCNTDDKRERFAEYITSLTSQFVDGIIVNSHNMEKSDLEALQKHNIPVVMIDRVLDSDLATSIAVKNREGARMATEHLVEIGCERIAHISGMEEEWNSAQRMWGYRDVVGDLPWFDQSWIGKAAFNVHSGYQVAKEIFSRHPEVDGIFCANDLIAIGTVKAAYEWGKKIPNDLAIVGFDGINMSEQTVPSLTTVLQPIYDMGQLAMEELIKKMEDKEEKPKKYVLDVDLLIRESTMRSSTLQKDI